MIVQLFNENLEQDLSAEGGKSAVPSCSTTRSLTPSWPTSQLLRSPSAPISIISGLLIALSERTRRTTAERKRFSDRRDSSRSGMRRKWSLSRDRRRGEWNE